VSDQFLGEIRLFAGNFAINGWAFCDGQTLSISQNQALFSLLGTTYGGNGVSTFQLPNLQGSFPVGVGQGTGLTNRVLGEVGGEASVTLVPNQGGTHNHPAMASSGAASSLSPESAVLATTTAANPIYGTLGQGTAIAMGPNATGSAGAQQPHNNLQPYLVLNFIIAITGIFPARN
jgi:microcystin-dependent protein